MTKTELFWRGLKSVIIEQIDFDNFNETTVREALIIGRKYIKEQKYLKRVPKIRDSDIWYIICESWLELLQQTDYYKYFKDFKSLENWIWSILAPTGFANHVIGYDTVYIKLLMTFENKLRKWYYDGHPDRKEALILAKALYVINRLEPEVLDKIKELTHEEKQSILI